MQERCEVWEGGVLCLNALHVSIMQFCNVFTAEDEMDEEDPTKNYKVGARKYSVLIVINK